jgi:hypothetical protein
MPDRIVRFILTGDSKGAVRAMEATASASEKTDRSLNKTGRQAQKTGGDFETMGRKAHGLRGHIGSLAGAIGVGGLAFGIKDVVQAGMHWQTQQAQLQASLRSTGLHGATLAAQVRTISDEVEKSSTHGGFAPAVETGGIAKLVTSTRSATKALELNAEVVAVARRAGLDYASAYSLVARAQTGQARGLAKYIGIVQPVTRHVEALRLAHAQEVTQLAHLTAAQKAANPGLVAQLVAARQLNPQMLRHAQLLDKQATATMVNARIVRQLGGATSAYSRIATGAISNASNGFEQMKEQLGRSFLPMVTKVGFAMASVARWMERHKQLATTLIIVLAALTIGLGTVKAAMIAVEIATAGWAAAQTALNFVLDANPIGLVVIAIAGLVAAIVLIITHFRQFQELVGSVFSWLKGAASSVVGFFKKHWWVLGMILAGPFAPIVLLISHLKEVKKLAQDITHLPGKVFGAAKGAVSGVAHFVSHPFGLHTGGLVPGFARGGYVGGLGNTDRIPLLAKPGEYMLREEVVQSVGVANLNSLNATGRMASGPQGDIVVPVALHLGSRVIAEEVVRYQLRQHARA